MALDLSGIVKVVKRQLAVHARRRLQADCHLARRRRADGQYMAADKPTILHGGLCRTVFTWPGGFAPLGSMAADKPTILHGGLCRTVFTWPGGFAPLGSMAAL